MEEQKHIYIMISETFTGFGRMIRLLGNVHYNHAAIALDPELSQIYAFARQRLSVSITARLVKENLQRYTLKKRDNVDVAVFKIPVTDEMYRTAVEEMEKIYNDDEYMYNLFSVLAYRFNGGMSVYKTFTCVEFVMHILNKIGFELKKPLCRYTPDELLDYLGDYIFFKGNLVDIMHGSDDAGDYFEPFHAQDIADSFSALKEIFGRTFFSGNHKVKKLRHRETAMIDYRLQVKD